MERERERERERVRESERERERAKSGEIPWTQLKSLSLCQRRGGGVRPCFGVPMTDDTVLGYVSLRVWGGRVPCFEEMPHCILISCDACMPHCWRVVQGPGWVTARVVAVWKDNADAQSWVAWERSSGCIG